MSKCMNCGSDSVIWDNNFDFEDFGYEGEGIVHTYHCMNCGAEIECRVRFDQDDSEETNEQDTDIQ